MYHYNFSFTPTDSIQLCAFRVTPGHRLIIRNYNSTPGSLFPQVLVSLLGQRYSMCCSLDQTARTSKLANCSLASVNEQFCSLHQELSLIPAKSSHKPLSCDIPFAFTLAFSVFTYCHCCWACDPFVSVVLAYNLITGWCASPPPSLGKNKDGYC